VSIAALEHNEKIENIKQIVQKLERILAPGELMLITLPAMQKQDWFFLQAYSWCFTEPILRYLFDLSESTPSNYGQHSKIFEAIKNSAELKNNLSWRYYYTRNSGMPFGRWNPQYAPVGVVKTKQPS
jgi:ubiquinone/menaquinone biosynthesis C-methylase UbiE